MNQQDKHTQSEHTSFLIHRSRNWQKSKTS